MVGSLKKEGKNVNGAWEDIDALLRTGTYNETIGQVDTIIASSIFNYINWQKLIKTNKETHSKNGLFFVANWNNGGVKKYFSKNRPLNKEEIEKEFQKNNYTILESYTTGIMGIILAQNN